MTQMEGLSKLQVAERQLAEAIRLFFERRDSVAIHTLAAAAQGVLRDIAKHTAKHSSILHNHPDVADEPTKAWTDHLNRARNFFKHADRDRNVYLLWNDTTNEQWLLDAVLLLNEVSGKPCRAANVYLGWITTKHPELRAPVAGNVVGDFCEAEGIASDDYAWFLEALDSRLLIAERGN